MAISLEIATADVQLTAEPGTSITRRAFFGLARADRRSARVEAASTRIHARRIAGSSRTPGRATAPTSTGSVSSDSPSSRRTTLRLGDPQDGPWLRLSLAAPNASPEAGRRAGMAEREHCHRHDDDRAQPGQRSSCLTTPWFRATTPSFVRSPTVAGCWWTSGASTERSSTASVSVKHGWSDWI